MHRRGSRTVPSRVAAFVMACAASGVGGEFPASDGRSADAAAVRCDGHRLTVQAERVPLPDLIAGIAACLGADVRGPEANAVPITLHVGDEPVESVLGRLLAPRSFTLRYDAEARLRVIALGPPTEATRTPTDPISPLLTRPVEVRDARLRQAVGALPTLPDLAALAATTVDPELRERAVEAALATVESDPELTRLLHEQLATTPFATVRDLVGAMAADRSRALMLQVMARARSEQIRGMATSLMRALPGRATGAAR